MRNATPQILATALSLLLLAGAGLTLPTAAHAEDKPGKSGKADQEKGLPIGKPPPEFRGKGYINCEPFDLASLRGKVVILQLAHTQSEPCKPQVEKLHEMLAEYGEKGLVVVQLFEEKRSKVEPWVEETKATYRVVAGNKKLRDRFGLKKGFPTTYLLDVDGNVIWVDNFADRAGHNLMEAVRQVSKYPYVAPQFKVLRELLRGQQFAAAGEEVEKARAIAGEDKMLIAQLDAVRAWLDSAGEGELAEAAKLLKEGDVWNAHAKYTQVAASHKGLPAGTTAAEKALELSNDKASAREIAAGDYFAELLPEAQKAESDKGRKAAAKVLRKVVKKYKGTHAAKRAQALVDRLDPK